MNTAEAEGHFGSCDVNTEAELPEFRLYKAHTGVCLESPDKQFDLKWVAKELNVNMKPSRLTELTDTTFTKFVHNPKKNSIIEVYAPRCISCQNQYNDLERILVAFDVVVVVSYDPSLNLFSSVRLIVTDIVISVLNSICQHYHTFCIILSGNLTLTNSQQYKEIQQCWITSMD